MLLGAGPHDRGKPIYHPDGVRTLEGYVRSMIQELVVHEWDARSGEVGEPGQRLFVGRRPPNGGGEHCGTDRRSGR